MKANKLLITLIFIVNLASVSLAQEVYKPQITREIILNSPDSTVRFDIYIKKVDIKINDRLIYAWYNADKLFFNQGGYSGRLLNGKYLVFDKNKKLRTEGVFSNGLKNGIWKTWNESGIITSTIKWEKGQREGESLFYDSYGKLKKVVPYKNNLIHGTLITYQGKNEDKARYKHGILIPEKEKKQKKPTSSNVHTIDNQEQPKTKTKKPFFGFLKKKEKKEVTNSVETSQDKEQNKTNTSEPKKSWFKNLFKKKEKSNEKEQKQS